MSQQLDARFGSVAGLTDSADACACLDGATGLDVDAVQMGIGPGGGFGIGDAHAFSKTFLPANVGDLATDRAEDLIADVGSVNCRAGLGHRFGRANRRDKLLRSQQLVGKLVKFLCGDFLDRRSAVLIGNLQVDFTVCTDLLREAAVDDAANDLVLIGPATVLPVREKSFAGELEQDGNISRENRGIES